MFRPTPSRVAPLAAGTAFWATRWGETDSTPLQLLITTNVRPGHRRLLWLGFYARTLEIFDTPDSGSPPPISAIEQIIPADFPEKMLGGPHPTFMSPRAK